MSSICQAAVKISTKGQAYDFYSKGDKVLLEDYTSSSGKTLKNAYRMCGKKCEDDFCKRHQENDMTFLQLVEEDNFNLAADIELEDGGYFAKAIKKSEVSAKKMKYSEKQSQDELQKDVEQIKIEVTETIMKEVMKLKEEFQQKLKELEEKMIIDPSTGKEMTIVEEKIEKMSINEEQNIETESEQESEQESENESEQESEDESKPDTKKTKQIVNEESGSESEEEEIEIEEMTTIDGRVIHVHEDTSNVYDVENGSVVGKLMRVDSSKHFEAPVQKLGEGYIVGEFFTYNDEEYIRDWLTNSVFEFSNDRCVYLKHYTLKIDKNTNEYTLIKSKSKKKKKNSS